MYFFAIEKRLRIVNMFGYVFFAFGILKERAEVVILIYIFFVTLL
jgi:hypothetical protein